MSLVRVYWNLHKHSFSVQGKYARQLNYPNTKVSWRVMKYIEPGQTLYLRDAKFVVRPAGRDKVRRTGRKNVHAYIKGQEIQVTGDPDWFGVSYDPYTHDTFIDDDGNPIFAAGLVKLDNVGHPIVGALNIKISDVPTIQFPYNTNNRKVVNGVTR